MASNGKVDTTSEISEMDATEDVAHLGGDPQESSSSMPPVSPSPSPPSSVHQSPSIASVCPPSSSPSDIATGWDASTEAASLHLDIPSSSSMVGNLNNLNIKSPLSLPDSPLSENSLTNELSFAVTASADASSTQTCPTRDVFTTSSPDPDCSKNRTSSRNSDESAPVPGSIASLTGVGVVPSADLAAATTDQHSSEEELECINRENSHPEKRRRSQVSGGGGGVGGEGGGERDVEEDTVGGGSSSHHPHTHHHHHHHHPHHPHHSDGLSHPHHHHHHHHSHHHENNNTINPSNNNSCGNRRSSRRCVEDPASPAIGETTSPPPPHSGSILISNSALCNNNNNNIIYNPNNNNNNNTNNNNANINNVSGASAGAVSSLNPANNTGPNAISCQAFSNNENTNNNSYTSGNMADSAGSSDEEVKEFMLDPKPVLFSARPPAGIHNVMRTTATNFLLPSQPSFGICAISPRKRHRLTSAPDSLDLENMSVIQRPFLDFEKMQKTLMRKHNSHSVSRAKIVKIKTISGNGTSSKCVFDPAVCSFRSISTAYSPLPPVEEPSCAY